MHHIDAHHHFWNPSRGDYDWMPKDNPILSRPYAPIDLADQLTASGVSKTVLVQAAATIAETEYMLGIADSTDFVAGVVGWIDFEKPSDTAQLARLSKHPKFLGVRPMIQDIADVDWMLGDNVQWAYQAIVDLGLTFDALGHPRHLPNFLTLLKRYPDMRVVLDHCMKPDIESHSAENLKIWADGMSRLADETQAFCKFSGLVTEASSDWTTEDLRPYSDHVLSAFGPQRVMWGSDWPVCRLRSEYGNWKDVAGDLTSHLPPADQARIFGGSATEFYRI